MLNKFGFTGNSTFIKNVEIIKNTFNIGSKAFYLICVVIGTVLLSIGSAFASGLKFNDEWSKTNDVLPCFELIVFNSYTAFIVGSACILIGTLGTYLDQDEQQKQNELLNLENKNLKKDLDNLREDLNSTQEELQGQKSENRKLNNDLVTLWLQTASSNLNFNSKERITIYYEYGDTFYLLARYSKNPEFHKVHRQKFPLNEGVISKAWRHGYHVEANCPLSSSNKYNGYLEKTYSYNEGKVNALTMKSCRYVALAITDTANHIGVIVFESTDDNFLKNNIESSIKEYCDKYQGQLSKFIRDGLELDREINVKRNNTERSVEKEFLQGFNGG